jgi:ketosteroid isomerase-like protein
MAQPDDAGTKEHIKQSIRELFRAENGPGSQNPDDYIVSPDKTPESIRAVAERILADDYLPITRGKGQVDLDRNDTLRKIVSGLASFRRHVDLAEIEVDLFLDGRVAIARTLLPTSDSKDTPPSEASYRNMHVFLKRDNEWRCVAWQVTRVQ